MPAHHRDNRKSMQRIFVPMRIESEDDYDYDLRILHDHLKGCTQINSYKQNVHWTFSEYPHPLPPEWKVGQFSARHWVCKKGPLFFIYCIVCFEYHFVFLGCASATTLRPPPKTSQLKINVIFPITRKFHHTVVLLHIKWAYDYEVVSDVLSM